MAWLNVHINKSSGWNTENSVIESADWASSREKFSEKEACLKNVHLPTVSFTRKSTLQCQLNNTVYFFAGTTSTRIGEVRVDREKTGDCLKIRESPPRGLD